MVTQELCSSSTQMLLPFKGPLVPFQLIYTPVKLSLGWIPEFWAARLHNKHFTHAFLWSVFCVYPKRVCMCVSLWEDGRLKLDLRGASWIHEGPLSCPRPIRCQTWIVRLESRASLWQIYLAGYSGILNRAACEWERNSGDVWPVCAMVSVKLRWHFDTK